ncbi:hypothetical protein [Actinacidiphila soli]|uniref:hypothetical protein n=1 Tax=Actinacidiphila soli TaxID=2487275 RepID=UPI0013E2F6B7|nr:hypothetical protein [Actinacidiphila soli]
MISAAGRRFSQCAARVALLVAALISVAGCGDAASSSLQSAARTAAPASSAAETELPTLESLESPAPSGKLLVAKSGRGTEWFDLPLTKAGSQVTLRLIGLGPGDAKVTDGSGGSDPEVAGCNATAAYATGFTGAKSDRVMRLAVNFRVVAGAGLGVVPDLTSTHQP